MGRNQYWAGRVYDLCVYYLTGTPIGSTESGFMEKPGIEPVTPGLQGIALIHYTTGASLRLNMFYPICSVQSSPLCTDLRPYMNAVFIKYGWYLMPNLLFLKSIEKYKHVHRIIFYTMFPCFILLNT